MITIFEMIKHPSRVSLVSSDIEHSSPFNKRHYARIDLLVAELRPLNRMTHKAKCCLCYKREPTADSRERERERGAVFPRDRIMGELVIRMVRRNIHRRHQHVEGER